MAEIKSLVARAQTVRELVTKYIPEIRKAIPKGMDGGRFARIALTMLPGRPDLLDCDAKTILGGILQAAAWGLELDPVLGMAYLVPYKGKAQIIIGYQGLITLARRSGEVKNIVPQTVYEKDEFDYELGLHPKLEHKPSPTPDRGKPIGYYAVATMRQGPPEFRFMWYHEVQAIRARSRAKDSGPWVTDEEAMSWKTVIRRLCKYLPRTVDLAKAIQMDEKVDDGVEQDLTDVFGGTIDVEPVTTEGDGKNGIERLAAALPEPAQAQGQAAAPATSAPANDGKEAPAAAARTEAPGAAAEKKEDERAEARRTGKPRGAAMPAVGDVFAPQQEREPGQEG